MKFIVDKEISLNSDKQGLINDLLHTKHYADILLQSIKDAPQGESYTIGLFGEWGSGKSSVIATMTENATKDPKLEKVKIVNYDAWKYSGDSFRRMFLYELRNALGVNESPLMQRFYINETHETSIKTSLNWKKIGIVSTFIIIAIIVVLVLKVLYGYGVAIPSTVALVALLFSLWTFVFDQLKVTIQKPLLFAPEQFEDCYKEMVGCSIKWDKFKEKTLKWITFGLHHEQYQRLVIVIDNIDRCQPDKAYTLLTDIKNFLCKEFDVIFIVPVDIYALRKHILKSSSEKHSIEADEFLRKFFNTSIWMKPFQNDEMYEFANKLAEKHLLGYKPDTVSLVANEFATNPRRIIQLFNNLQIELAMYETDFALEHQALICKLLIIREEFPIYYRQLMNKPGLLFVDVAAIRTKDVGNRSVDEQAIFENKRLFAFLLASSGISSRYAQSEDVVNQILVNTQTINWIPESIRIAYKTADAEALSYFVQDIKRRELLINYLQDNIKKMVSRQTIDSVGKVHFNVLLILFDKGMLSSEDKNRLFAPMESENTLFRVISLYKDKTSLIRLGKDLEDIRLPKLSDTIEGYFKTLDDLVDALTEDDVVNLFYAASIWDVERCKIIAPKFIAAYQRNPVGCSSYNYSKEKLEILFTSDIYNYLFNQMNAEECEDEKSAFRSFKHLCHINAVDKKNLILFVKKAAEKAVSYDYNNPNNEVVTKYLKMLSDIFAEVNYLGRCVPVVEMISLFNKINGAHSVTSSQGYNRNITTNYSYVKDKASDATCAEVLMNFFTNANLITDGSVVSNAEIERFTDVEVNRDRVLEALMFLKGKGIDVLTWTNAVIKDPRRTDVKRIEILKSVFVRKEKEGAYEVADDVVKNEITEMIKLIQTHADGQEQLVDMFNDLLNDERIDKFVREILSGKTLEEQKQLPLSLMQRAITSFEKNIGQLSIDNDVNVLQLVASNGSPEGIEGVWGIINPILADGKNRQPKSISNAIQVLLSFSKLTKEQAEALAGNVKALPDSKLSNDNKNEALKYIEDHIE